MPQLGFPTLGVQTKEFLVQTILGPHGSSYVLRASSS
jgi:hypothetical protein